MRPSADRPRRSGAAAWRVRLGRPLVELAKRLLGLPLALFLSVAFGARAGRRPGLRMGIRIGPGLACGPCLRGTRHRIPLGILLSGLLPGIEAIAGGQLDLEVVQFIPLGVGALAVRDGLQFLQAAARGCRLRCIHGDIIPLFGEPCPPPSPDWRKTFFATE